MQFSPENLPDDIPSLKGMVISFSRENQQLSESQHRYEMENKLLPRDQEVIAKLSIPITYTHYVDFIIDIEGNQYRVAPPFDTRTEIISIPEEEDMVVDFGKNIQEEQGNGTVF